MIAIVDYGMGNLRSVERAFAAIGAEAKVTSDAADLERALRIVVPGVGAFGDAMQELSARGLLPAVRGAVAAGKPYLGICLGMQILFEEGEEFGRHAGLGLLPGRVVRFTDPTLKVPHLGWNRLLQRRPHPVLASIEDGAHFYFVHSYHAVPAHAADIAGETEYGARFVSAVASKNVFACQFHPEKSQALGLELLQGFVRWQP
jgi:glutamine amidotransferase